MSTHDEPIAEAIQILATHVKYLGNGDNAGTMGAVEFLATKIDEAGERVAHAIDRLAASNEEIAEAIAGAARMIANGLVATERR
jgi:hypothetical protein